MYIRFVWDLQKADSNFHKHGVTFEDATEVFDDPSIVFIADRVVEGEQRWQALGLVEGSVLLLVAHTSNEVTGDATVTEIIRIISARTASRMERKRYEQENNES